ncbi:16S rRNA (guanine(527)-N(7))-methyltransferase RsmG [Sphingomonas xinjiangensis]|uniref:Ribosomal RNA small subunit methyltransferase G n=1 Tax=Sphingomonas xinjiangensis TaxID=643568 RepID=A0A840YML5_9SPHN|nr:16S rRNA (guanine(527)-N(7))-methyltransferase RsmG [Sphingomonas xinjiangensis]MBB5711136.1 16S rRNA (guanine527-N7)-methyltransferase [Sphingomonas xinjiangensis]
MSEEQAREWVRATFGVSRETQLERFAAILTEASAKQNLISASTLDTMWTRHITDSAQLVPLASNAGEGAWLDIGSGAGLPGIVAAILSDRPVVLVEPRVRRVEFLREAALLLGLTHVSVEHAKVEAFTPSQPAAIVSARAVAELSKLLAASVHCTSLSTLWVLPKGRQAETEVAAARRKWHGSFHVEPSMTQPESGIVVAIGVRPR